MRSSPCLIGFQRMRDSMQADPENIDTGSKFSKVFNSCFYNRAQKVVLVKLNWNGLFFYFLFITHMNMLTGLLLKGKYISALLSATQMSDIYWTNSGCYVGQLYILLIFYIYLTYISHTFCKYILGHFNVTKTNLHSVSYQ